MDLKLQDKSSLNYYEQMLGTIGSLSRLFSEGKEPYIQYRIAENLFCKSFNAKNLSRTDCSADASIGTLGIGIKTFLEKNGATIQKIAEFNSEHNLFNGLGTKEKILKIAELRNKRIEATQRIFGLDRMIYHCVTRKDGAISVYEIPMDFVDISNIKNIEDRGNIISFEDGINEYSFNNSKSTLYKRFLTGDIVLSIPVSILEDPFDALQKMFPETKGSVMFSPIQEKPHVFLPLYSMSSNRKLVRERSGLNQWNAAGRERNSDEAYIQIPAWIHRKYPGFFPERDQQFDLLLPDGRTMAAKVCQAGSKALMSNPNSALGEWILRDVLDLGERELLTYEKLEEIGLDSVVIYRAENGSYEIDFAKIGSYEGFANENSELPEEEGGE